MVSVRAHFLLLLSANALLFSLGVGVSRADESSLAPVRQAIDEIRYEEASQLLEQVLARGELHAQSLADAYRLSGEVLAALGDLEHSRERFARFLTLDPEAQLPPGTSPKILAAFMEARAELLAKQPLLVRHQASRNAGSAKVELSVDADPLGMVSGVRVTYGVGENASLDNTAETRDGLSVMWNVSDEDWLRLQVMVLDEHGNELFVLGEGEPTALAPLPRPKASPPVVIHKPRRAWYAKWYTYTGIAVAAGGAGLYFGAKSRADAAKLAALNDDSATRTFAEARAIEERGKRNALIANVSFGAAGISTAAAIICFWRESAREPATMLTPHVARNGAGLTVKRRF